MLGTFITEWDAGAATCKQLFGTAATAQHTAHQLANIAAWYGFEGWLVNIENDLDPSSIDHVLLFLRCAVFALCRCTEHAWDPLLARELTMRMQQQRLDAMVLWYDAVTVQGTLCWQNTLNEANR